MYKLNKLYDVIGPKSSYAMWVSNKIKQSNLREGEDYKLTKFGSNRKISSAVFTKEASLKIIAASRKEAALFDTYSELYQEPGTQEEHIPIDGSVSELPKEEMVSISKRDLQRYKGYENALIQVMGLIDSTCVAPKAERTYKATEIADELGITVRLFNAILVSLGVLIYSGTNYRFSQSYSRFGFGKMGSTTRGMTTVWFLVWTEKGRQWILKNWKLGIERLEREHPARYKLYLAEKKTPEPKLSGEDK